MTAIWLTTVALALFTGVTVGVFVAGLLAASGRAEMCRRCHGETLEAAFRELDSFGGTDS